MAESRKTPVIHIGLKTLFLLVRRGLAIVSSARRQIAREHQLLEAGFQLQFALREKAERHQNRGLWRSLAESNRSLHRERVAS
jgi:hypothetical protein